MAKRKGKGKSKNGPGGNIGPALRIEKSGGCMSKGGGKSTRKMPKKN